MSGPAPAGLLRRAGLWWALAHAPLILLFSVDSAAQALTGLPTLVRVGLVLAWGAGALVLALWPYLLTLPLSPWPRLYRYALPLATGLWCTALFVDGRIYRALTFHVNGLLLRLLLQPNALRETGLTGIEVAVAAAGGALFVAAELGLGGRLLPRFASPRRAWPWVAAVLGLMVVERIGAAAMAFYAGPAVKAASHVLPLQAPLSMNKLLGRMTGRSKFAAAGDVAAALQAGVATPYGRRDAADVRFTRRPDVVLVAIESVRDEFLDQRTMPRLWARAARGARFTRHYASASSTHYAVFSLFYGLDSRRFDQVVAEGRRPLLFGALRANGYRLRLLAASSVDWMGLRETVFHDVDRDLETDFPGSGMVRDSVMLVRAQAFVSAADTAPLFLFLFFDGTHFRYTFPDDQTPFTPFWAGGASTMSAVREPPRLIENRARNAAYEVDRKLDELLTWITARRGREPLVLVTADHGEEYREKGRLGHGYDVTAYQVHVPMTILGPGVTPQVVERVTAHQDIVPTLLTLLGDTAATSAGTDGLDMFRVPPGRFIVTQPGWIPRYAVIGEDVKASFFGLAAGFGDMLVTDPEDRPIPDGEARLARHAAAILRAIGGARATGAGGR